MTTRICYDCANFGNGRLTMRQRPDGDYEDLVDERIVLAKYRNPPSRKVKCRACGRRVQAWMEVA